MQHIIIRLLTAGDDDSFRDKYYWDAARNRLYLVDSTPAVLLVSAFHEELFASSSFKRTTIVSRPDIQAETEPSGTCLSISIGQEWGGR